MPRELFPEKIKEYFDTHWKDIIREAEEYCLQSSSLEVGSVGHIEKIKERTRDVLLSRLEDLKGDWLYVTELEYTLDLFNARCETYEYFVVLKHKNVVKPPAGSIVVRSFWGKKDEKTMGAVDIKVKPKAV